MKPRKTTAAIMSLILISTVLAFYTGTVASSKSKVSPSGPQAHYSFTLTATGTALDRSGHDVAVSISLFGTADGSLATVLSLHVEGGDVQVENYGTVSASKGAGVSVVKGQGHVHLEVMLTPLYYGGRNTVWVIYGGIDSFIGNIIDVSLYCNRAVLPLEGYPRLTHVSLTGTITLS